MLSIFSTRNPGYRFIKSRALQKRSFLSLLPAYQEFLKPKVENPRNREGSQIQRATDGISFSNARGTRYPVPVWSVAPQRTILLKTARDRESCPRKSIWRGNPLRASPFQRAPGRPGRPATLSRAGHETPPCDQGGDSPLDSSRAAPRGRPRGIIAARDIRSVSFPFFENLG